MKCPKCETINPADPKFCRECATPLPGASPLASSTETFQAPVRELSTGSTFAGRYQIIEELGHGGMGRVYKAFDTEIKEKIALKLLKPEIGIDLEIIERFRNELKLARKISQRNVCRMHDLNREEGAYYLTMEYVHGEDLKRLIRKVGQMSAGKTISIAKQVCDGLSEAHSLGIVHRDLKPQNIMVDEAGNAKIMDFGIARSLTAKGITGAGVMIGTPEYMSPEQVEGKDVDQRSDIYSLGVILYEMATGRVPFEGDTPFTVGVKHKSEIPKNPRELNAHLPEDLSRVILKCLEKDKAARYQGADALRADLAKVEEGLPTTEKEIPKRKSATTKDITVTFNIRKLLLPALGLLVLITAGLILWEIFFSKKPAAVATTGKPSIAVMYFENQTDKPGLDRMLVTLLTTNLSRNENIQVTSTQRLFDILKLLGKQDAQVIDKSLATDVAVRAGVKNMLLGSIIQIGGRIRLTSELIDVKSGSLLGTQAEDGAKYDDIFGMVDRVTEQVAKQVGAKTGGGGLKVAEVTTSSLEAMNNYQKGYDQMLRNDYRQAAQLLLKAVEIDPTFAKAQALLALAQLRSPAQMLSPYNDRTEPKKTLEMAKKYSHRATDNEQLFIRMIDAVLNRNWPQAGGLARELISRNAQDKNAFYIAAAAQWYAHDFQGAVRTLEKAIENDPTDGFSYNLLGYSYIFLNDYPAAMSAIKKYMAVHPDVGNSHDDAWDINMWAGRYDEALAYADEAMRTHPDWWSFNWQAGWALIHQGKGEAARERFHRLAQNDPNWSSWANQCTGYSYLGEGREKEAQAELAKTLELDQKDNLRFEIIFDHFELGEAFLIQGKFTEALAQFQDAEKVSGKYYKHQFNPIPLASRLYAGRAFVKQRQYDKAEAAAQEIKAIIQKQNMEPPFLDFYYLLEAESAMDQNRPEDALRSLGRASFSAWWSSPFYWRTKASAEEALGRFEAAVESYKKFQGWMMIARQEMRDPVRYFYELSMADYNLGRLAEKMKNPTAAKEHYQKFLDRMKNADPGLPEVGDARKRLAGL